jgi:TatD DNase family protein
MLIDAHTHLDRYTDRLDAALSEIETHRILTVTTSMSVPSYERNLEIAERCRLVLPIFGIHPWNASGYAEDLNALGSFITRSPMLGEIGLDYHFVRRKSRYGAQRKVFEYFLAAARDQRKIVNLHTKGAEADVLVLLERYKVKRAIVHWYSGPMDILRDLVTRGTYFTIGVEIMRSNLIKAIAAELPSELLLTETDNPGGLKWLTGSVGLPAAVVDVIRHLSEVRNSSPEGIIKTVHANFKRLMWGDEWLSDIYERFFQDTATEP